MSNGKAIWAYGSSFFARTLWGIRGPTGGLTSMEEVFMQYLSRLAAVNVAGPAYVRVVRPKGGLVWARGGLGGRARRWARLAGAGNAIIRDALR